MLAGYFTETLSTKNAFLLIAQILKRLEERK